MRSWAVLAVLCAASGCEDDPPPECAPGETACGRRCVSVDEDPANCGGCGRSCDDAEVCYAGSCRAACPAGTSVCGRTCRALTTDPAHCGACEAACARTEVCRRGACVCPDGLVACADGCVDAATDVANCGGCGETCADGESCVGGACGCVGERRETACDDGVDDDCDGAADCRDADCAGSVVACSGACGAGIRPCLGDARGACLQGDGGAEVCGNGIDDDCDGESRVSPDHLEPTDTCAECYGLPEDPAFEVAETTIDSVFDAVDCYRFHGVDDAAYAERIEVALSGIPDGLDLDLHLYRGLAACEARTPLASSMRGPGEDEAVSFVETLAADDTADYYLRVVRVSGASCEEGYVLSVEGLD